MRLTCYVDDASIEAAGSASIVEEHLTEATSIFTGELQKVGLEFSATKNVVSASTPALQSAIARRLSGLRMKASQRVKSLGMALGAGVRRNMKVAKCHLGDFKKRKGRFRLLKKCKGSVPRILKTGGIQGMCYGQESMGVSSSVLHSQRQATAATLVSRGSGDLELRLALADGSGKA